MTQHTQGRLTLDYETDISGIENDPENGCVGKVDVAHVYLRTVPGRTEANARRLVAAWNACEGIDTYALEVMTGDLSVSNQIAAIASRKPTGKKTAYRTQRDELLAALTHIEGAALDLTVSRHAISEAAHAAIAKVEKS